ncbi:MAG: argininosuccinate lyase, partial [Oscillospiraceae bacterium]
MALWAGRFKKEIDKRTNDFNSSVRFDARMYKDDITGSIVHSEMLAKQGIISAEDKTLIHKGLLNILDEIENGTL